MVKYSAEERARIREAARAALESAEATLAAPRPAAAALPPIEDKLAKWKREAREQEERFARERAAPQPLTDYEAAQFQRDSLAGQLAEQKDLLLAVLAHALAAMRDEVLEQLEAKIAALSDELGQVRADLTIARAFNNNKTDADVIDLPTLPLRRRAG